MSITPKGTGIPELYRLYRTGKLIVNRQYQRKLVWTKDEKASLVESVLLDYPIPLILLGEVKLSDGDSAFEIIDGMQRLNALFGFIENQFAVNGSFFDVRKHPYANELLLKHIFKSVDLEKSKLLEPEQCVKFLEYQLAVTIYQPKQPNEIEHIFNRINSSGKHLSPQEVRQAGVTSRFSNLVRSLASEIRGDVSREVLPLTEMPAISIDAKSIDLGYGVRAEDTIWCNQAIMRVSDLRDSDDEQFLADIILSIALGSPFAASKSKFDNYYSKGDVDKSDEIDVAIARYGENNLGEDIKKVLSWIQTVITAVAGTDQKNFLSKTLNPKAKGNTVKEPFYSLFMAFYDLIIKNSKEPFVNQDICDAVYDLASKIKMSSTTTERNRVNNIGLTKGLIENYFKSSTTATRSSGSYALDFVNYLRRSRIESPNYDFKQGLYTLSSSNRQFDEGAFEKILQNLAAMANLGRGKKGYIFIGVSDNEQHSQRIEKLDGIIAPRVDPFGIVGLEREARLRGNTLDDYILSISRKIRESDLPEVLKTRINTSLTPITYEGHTVLMLESSACTDPVWYKNKLYIRDGHEKKPQEVSGDQIAAVYSLFK